MTDVKATATQYAQYLDPASGPVATSAKNPAENSKPSPYLPYLRTALENSDHVLFGEPHINDMILKSYQFLQKDFPFEIAHENGYRHLVLEWKHRHQHSVDQFMEGEIGGSELQDRLFNREHPLRPTGLAPELHGEFQSTFMDVLQKAKAAGFKVHMADYTAESTWAKLNQIPFPAELTAYEAEEAQAWNRKLNTDEDLKSRLFTGNSDEAMSSPVPSVLHQERSQHYKDFYAGLPPERQQRIKEIYQELYAEMRRVVGDNRGDDRIQFEQMSQSIPAGEGVIGMVGSGHLNNSFGEHGIDELLPGKVTSIELNANHQMRRQISEILLKKDSNGNPPDPPEMTIMLDEGRVYGRNMEPLGHKPDQPRYLPQPEPNPGF